MTRRALPLLLLLILLLPLAAAAWTMEGGDARRANTVTLPIPTADVTLAWSGEGQFTGILVMEDGSIVGTGDPVTVWEPDGTVRWSTRTVGAQQQVYRARGGGGILSDGTIVTAGTLPFGAPAVVGYDPATGAQRFVNKNITDNIRGGCDSPDENDVAVATDDSFYVGGCGSGLLAFHANGTLKWAHKGEAERVALHGSLVLAETEDLALPNGTTYADALMALSQSDGKLVWATKLADGQGADPMVGPDGTIYLTDAGAVKAFSSTDGAMRWETLVPRPYALGIAPNGTLAAGSSNRMAWVSPTGALLGLSPTVDGSTMLVGEKVHLKSYGSSLSAVDATGKTLWTVTGTTRTFQSHLALADDGTIYIAEDGFLRAYRGTGGTAASGTTGATPPTSAAATPSTDASPEVSPGGTGASAEKGTPGATVALSLVAVAILALTTRRRAR